MIKDDEAGMLVKFQRKKASPTDQRTSVILRRQVPIRFDEAPRSWLGGLPMMPDDARWPRDIEDAPLHFVAQIACADLPAELWNARGPREGWLLLFVEVLKLEDCGEGGLVQVLHVDRLGREREPPADVPTVRHVMSDDIDWTGPNIRPRVPKMWRRWPVDLVVQHYRPSESDELGGPSMISAEDLYKAPMLETGIVPHSILVERPLT
jgi:Domain of unknown function (DUF1963)